VPSEADVEALGITVGDLAVLGVLVIAGLMGLALGLVKAILFVGCWVGAALVTLYAFPHAKVHFYQFIENQLYADITAAASIFLVCLVILFWIGSRIWGAVRNSSFSSLDRSLGLLGGLLVGALLICIAYLGATWMWNEKELPELITQARARPYVQVGANWIRGFVPQATQKKAESAVDTAQERMKKALETEKAMRELLKQQGSGVQTPPDTQKGYAEPSRRDMDRLIENKQ